MPVAVNDCGLPSPSLVTVTTALRSPAAAGVNVTAMLHVPAGATVVQPGAETANSAGALLVMLEMVTAVPPLLVTVTVCGPEVVPMRCGPSASVDGNVSCPWTGADAPVPLAATICGLPVPLLVTVMLAVRAPVADGVKVTAKLHVPPAATVVHVLADTANSPGALLAMLDTVTAAPLALVRVTVDGELDAPTFCVPNATCAGTVSVPLTGPEVPLPSIVKVFGLPAAELVNVTIELLRPVDVGENVTLIAHVPAGAIVVQLVVAAKSAVLLVTPLTVTGVAPLFVTLMASGALVAPTAVPGKLSELGEKASWAVAEPTRDTVALPELLATVIVPLRRPLELGLNATETVQVAPLASELPQLLVMSKSAELLLLTETPESEPPLVLVTVTLVAAVTEPTEVEGKLTLAGETLSGGGVPGMTEVVKPVPVPLPAAVQVHDRRTPSVL